MHRRNWTQEEREFLEEKWGVISIDGISRKLKRTPSSVIEKAQRLGLGAFLEGGEYITYNQLRISLGRFGGGGYDLKSWFESRGFPIRYKKVRTYKFKIVYIDEFWDWAEKNRDFVDFSKMEENILGIEPDWVKLQRKLDQKKKIAFRTDPWTKLEDEELKRLLKMRKYTYMEISKILRRTCGAIQKRVCDLNIKERPVKVENKIMWTAAEIETLNNMLTNGYSYELISDVIGRSSKAIRGKAYTMYGTENIDNIINGKINPSKHKMNNRNRNQRRAAEKSK